MWRLEPGYAPFVAQSESLSVTVGAPAADVLAFLRDIDNQKSWFPGNIESEVLERDADGLVARARLVNDVKVAKDEFLLDYTHTDDGFSWVLVKPTSVQKSQVGSWRVIGVDDDRSEVTMTLTVDTSLPMPGFVQKRIIKDTLKGATSGLAKQF
jgi:ribosome-associated toxin RatA of RatAB toxin-antitoxin module